MGNKSNRRRQIKICVQIRLPISVRFEIQQRNQVDDCNFDIKLIHFDLKMDIKIEKIN